MISSTNASPDDSKPTRKIQKKVIVIGEGGVGKTTLLHRSVSNIFVDSTKMTIGTDFFMKKIEIEDDKNVNQIILLLWDFAGQERFRFILKDYIKGAKGVILCFDLTRASTLQKLYDWIELLKEGNAWGNPDIRFFLSGNKKDLVASTVAPVTPENIEVFRKEFNIDKYFETSAMDSTGVEDLFNKVASSMVELENKNKD
ncbi:Rab family GTPase [Promethearchaeum syntrophicum]|uniref:Rab family GTPase n=1 Tax=Promethearchaeum syntrophicum TaxID=2594042 RepID=A0A5B9D909_9ARCH|nr:Rab family GTPase [Candidatus Prometheoarchaeum syntrophicum]QEE15553.1 Ras family protein [Candidatus Prometheoarchaeum syntrophicum]